MADLTPMKQQYNRIKAQYSDCILFFRLGDFYEMFDDDARLVSKELDLTLTTRDRGKPAEEQTPMCGVPYHSCDAYIARLIAKGYKVAICEQLEDPALAKGLVDRDIVRIITPGTVIDSSMLDESKPNYMAAIFADEGGWAVCFADLSTGEICVRAFTPEESPRILNELGRFSPSEAVLNDTAAGCDFVTGFLHDRLECLFQANNDRFDYARAEETILGQFSVSDLRQLGLAGESQAVCAVGALVSYLIDTQKTSLSHINHLDFYTDGKYMELDPHTARNLELTASMRTGEKKGSLLSVLDRTKTPMGSRMLRSWVSRPFLTPAPINRRLAAVNELYAANTLRPELMLTMRGMGDMERLIGKVAYGSANCRDLSSLAQSIARVPQIRQYLSPMQSTLLKELAAMDPLEDVQRLIDSFVTEKDIPFSVREGGFVKQGYNAEVDRLRDLLNGSTGAMADIEAREKARTGKKLKVSFNKVFGYYIEIPRAQSSDVPEDYERKQTLVNSERFTTAELKELEVTLLTAKDSLAALEYELFCRVRERLVSQILRIQATASAAATVDALCSLAETAAKNGYTMPQITLDGVIDIRDGRHPVVEAMASDALFVPNDTRLDLNSARTAIITGPNMAGKSTYMRQTALIVLMAQMGSFVPARSASIGLADRVFTRIGASDDLAAGRSTFMVEMSEVSDILQNATSRSLLILDEIGRGTSTYDGMAIARAVVEYCTDKRRLGTRTMFATHYHELTALEEEVEGVFNLSISAKKRGDDLIFLRKIVPGGADDSYGIEVAHLAGVPDWVIRRAKAVLTKLEEGASAPAPARAAKSEENGQYTLDGMGENELTRALRSVDLNTVTPIEALNLLYELKKKAGI